MENLIKVSSKSNPNSVAGAITNILKEYDKVEITAIGAGAVNQAIKSVAVARGYVAPVGKDIICIPYFGQVTIDDYDTTAMKIVVEYKK